MSIICHETALVSRIHDIILLYTLGEKKVICLEPYLMLIQISRTETGVFSRYFDLRTFYKKKNKNIKYRFETSVRCREREREKRVTTEYPF